MSGAASTPYRATEREGGPIELVRATGIREGVELRSRHWGVAACRRPDGSIVTAYAALQPEEAGAAGWPLVRGAVRAFHASYPAVSFLAWSSWLLEGDADTDDDGPAPASAKPERLVAERPRITVGPIVTFVVWMMILALVGQGAVALVRRIVGVDVAPLVAAAIAASGQLFAWAGYMLALRRNAELRRVCCYGTAAQKVLIATARGEPAGITELRRVSPLNPYHGASFFAALLILWPFVAGGVSHLLASVGVWQPSGLLADLAIEAICLPVVYLVTFELQRGAWSLFRAGRLGAVWPILCSFQRVTAVEPEDGELEVALVALRDLMERERAGPEA